MTAATLVIRKLAPDDRSRWTEMWQDYLWFYETVLPDAIFDFTWSRLMDGQELHGLVAQDGGDLVGMTHFLYHQSAWTLEPVCYLQDLFTDASFRNRGTARALISAVAEAARQRQSPRLYWLTQSDNDVARTLYDKVAKHTGFIRYEYPL